MSVALEHEVKEVSWPETSFFAVRSSQPIDSLGSFFSEAYKKIYSGLAARGIQPAAPYAIYFVVDKEKETTDVAAAVPVPPAALPGSGIAKITIPASRALLLEYTGPYESMHSAYATLDEYVEKNRLEKAWTLEQYLTDPATQSDQSKWRTNIYYIVK